MQQVVQPRLCCLILSVSLTSHRCSYLMQSGDELNPADASWDAAHAT